MVELCQICYEPHHNAQICPWRDMKCLLPNCDGVWIFHEEDESLPLQGYNADCVGYRHLDWIRHDEVVCPTDSLTCQLCAVAGHEAYQCSHLYSYYHEPHGASAQPNMQSINDTPSNCHLSSESGCRHEIFLYDDSTGYFICQCCFLQV